MSDGVSLKTRMFFPHGTGPWPVIVIRNPYAAILPMLAAIASLWTHYGYVVVLQDCRGTGDSAGNWNCYSIEEVQLVTEPKLIVTDHVALHAY